MLVNVKLNTWVSTFHQICLFGFPSSCCGVDRLLLRESCPWNSLRAKIYALNNLSFLGLKSINWMISPLGPGSCPTHFVSNQGRGKAAKGLDLEEACHLKPLSLNFHSNSQYKMREMTQENSCALKNHSIHPGVLRIICYHIDYPVTHSTAQERNLYLGDWERRGEGERKRERERKDWMNYRGNKREKGLRSLIHPWQVMQPPSCKRFWWLYSRATQQTRAVGLGPQQLCFAPACRDQEDPSRRCPGGPVFMSFPGNW